MTSGARIAAAGVAGVVALTGGIYLATGLFAPDPDSAMAACRAGQVAGDIGGPFELVDETGATVTDADVITEPAILYFGYTFCPDVCPLDNARNAEAVDLLAERGISATPVFISVDPERDDPEGLRLFTEAFHDKMIGLTGSDEQVRAVTAAYKTYYRAQEDDGSGYYLVDHSTFSYLVLPDTGFADFFRRDETAEQVADRVQCFVEATAS